MDSSGAFGDLLAAFNIDSTDSDIANATSQYEAKPNRTDDDTEDCVQIEKLQDNQLKTEIKDKKGTQQEVQCADKSKPFVKNEITKVYFDDDTNKSLTTDSSKMGRTSTIWAMSGTTSASTENCAKPSDSIPEDTTTILSQISSQISPQLPSIITGQTSTQLPPVITGQVSPQLPPGTMLLPNLPQNAVLTSQPLIQSPLQSFVQNVQVSNGFPVNQLPINAQSAGVYGSSNIAELTGQILPQGMLQPQGIIQPQGMLQGLPTNHPTAAMLNLGSIQNGLIAVPMSLLPRAIYQNPSMASVQTITTVAETLNPGKPHIMSSRKINRKSRPNGTSPTVQELLDERRIQNSPVVPVAVNEKVKVIISKSDVRSGPSEIRTRSKTGRRKHTKRYVEFMHSKDESEDEQELPQNFTVNKKHVIDVNKPITDQLISISDPARIQIANVQSLSNSNSSSHNQSHVSDQTTTVTTPAMLPNGEMQLITPAQVITDEGSSNNSGTLNKLHDNVFPVPSVNMTGSGVTTSPVSNTTGILPVEIKHEKYCKNPGAVESVFVNIKQEPIHENHCNNITSDIDTPVVGRVLNSLVTKNSATLQRLGGEDNVSEDKQGEAMSMVLSDGMRIKSEPIEKGCFKSDTEYLSQAALTTDQIKSELLSRSSEDDQLSDNNKKELSSGAIAVAMLARKNTTNSKNKLKARKRKSSPDNKPTKLVKRKKKTKIKHALSVKQKKLKRHLAKKFKKEPKANITSTGVSAVAAKCFKNTIYTREEEERIASKAAARAASEALVRAATKATYDKNQKAAAERIKAATRQAKAEEQNRKEKAAAIKIQEAANRAASEAANRSAMTRMVAGAMESGKKNEVSAELATRAASEAAARAVAEAAIRCAATVESPQDLRLAARVQKEAEDAKQVASLAAARAAAQAAIRASSKIKSTEDLLSEEKHKWEVEKARVIASEATARALAVRALAERNNATVVAGTTNARVRNIIKLTQEAVEKAQQKEEFTKIAGEAAARAVLSAQTRTSDFVPILPALPGSYSKPTHIKQILNTDLAMQLCNIANDDSMIENTKEVHKVVTPNKQIITYPKNPSKNLRESLAWKSFQEGVKQGKYRIVQKTNDSRNVGTNGRRRNIESHSMNVIGHDMRCPYCLIQMKIKANLIQHVTVCLINPQTHDEEYLDSHTTADEGSAKAPVLMCTHCSPNATSVKDIKGWSNVLCRLCVTKCADPKITVTTEDHYVITTSDFYVCKHCGIGLDSETDMKHHLSHSKDSKDTGDIEPLDEEVAQKFDEKSKKILPGASKLLPKKEHDPTFQFRCGQCRLMFASVGLLLVHTSHCNLNQYIKVLERLSHYNCINCPAACKIVSDDRQPHKCRVDQQTSFLKKALQAVRDISVSKESYVCLRCEEILPSNGHLILHTKQCNHAQYHLLMRYLDQPPYCNRCYKVFTGYKAYSQHSQKCMKITRHDSQELEYFSQTFCSKCQKGVQREEVDQMYHNAVCAGLPCTQQKLLFPDGFNIRECCTVINSW